MNKIGKKKHLHGFYLDNQSLNEPAACSLLSVSSQTYNILYFMLYSLTWKWVVTFKMICGIQADRLVSIINCFFIEMLSHVKVGMLATHSNINSQNKFISNQQLIFMLLDFFYRKQVVYLYKHFARGLV